MSFKKPLILKRQQILSTKLPQSKKIPIPDFFGRNHKVNSLLYREDVIYDSNVENLLKGEYLGVTIVNRLNNYTNASLTIAKITTLDNAVIEKTSESVTKVIGQENYNTLFYALCSVINQEYRIRGILSLLTANSAGKVASGSTNPKSLIKLKIDQASQTDETRLVLKKGKVRKRQRKILTPYVVCDEEKPVKKIVVDPHLYLQDLKKEECKVKEEQRLEIVDIKKVENLSAVRTNSELPDLGYLKDYNDNSNDSNRSFSTIHTFKTIPDLMIDPISLIVDQCIKKNESVPNDDNILPNHRIVLMDKSEIRIPFKPEDDFHIATKENLQFLNEMDRKKLLLHQMQIDYRCCTSLKDVDGNLPIHLAVNNNDIELLKRQCVVLKLRNQSVDIPANGSLTALKLSLFCESTEATAVLLQHGADPTLPDEDHSTSLHIAAELNTDHLSVIIHHCKLDARGIIYQHVDELATPGWENLLDHQLADKLINFVCCNFFDKQGNTPLMLASKLGLYENVRILLDSAPTAVNLQNPNSGNTALYVTVAAAYAASAERGNKSKVVDHFRKTIEILLEYGADPTIDNLANSNVNLLLGDINCVELCMLIANKVVNTKYFNGDPTHTKNCDNFILIKNTDGNVNIREISQNKNVRKLQNKTIIVQNVPKKPVIVENILLKSPGAKIMPKLTHSTEIIVKVNEKRMAGKKMAGEMLAGKKMAREMLAGKKMTGEMLAGKKMAGGKMSSSKAGMRQLIVYPMKRKSGDEEENAKKAKK